MPTAFDDSSVVGAVQVLQTRASVSSAGCVEWPPFGNIYASPLGEGDPPFRIDFVYISALLAFW